MALRSYIPAIAAVDRQHEERMHREAEALQDVIESQALQFRGSGKYRWSSDALLINGLSRWAVIGEREYQMG